jgi:hypothetical protein
MQYRPTALGWIDHDLSVAADWDRAQVQRLARHLGYQMIWPPIESVVPLVDQVRAADVDVVITPSPEHLDVITLNSVMSVVAVESVCPRLSFARWADTAAGRLG